MKHDPLRVKATLSCRYTPYYTLTAWYTDRMAHEQQEGLSDHLDTRLCVYHIPWLTEHGCNAASSLPFVPVCSTNLFLLEPLMVLYPSWATFGYNAAVSTPVTTCQSTYCHLFCYSRLLLCAAAAAT